MDRSKQAKVFTVLVAGIPVLLAAAASPDVQRFFSYGLKPSSGLIEVSLDSTMPAARTQYTVYSDGRLLIRKYQLVGSEARLEETLETALDVGQLEVLLKDVVDSGLATYDPAETTKRLRPDPRGLAHSSEGAVVRFQIALDYLAEGASPARAPFVNMFSTTAAPEVLARAYPGEKAYVSFDRLLKVLSDLEESARGRKP